MFDWLTNLLLGSTSDAALESALYSAGLPSGFGMHQEKEPEGLQELAQELKNHQA